MTRSLLAIAAIAFAAMFTSTFAVAQDAGTATTTTAAVAAAGGTTTPAAPIAPAAAAAPAAPAPRAKKLVRARVLVDGAFGKCNAVVELDSAEAKAGAESGELDLDKAAVAYAESLASGE